METTAKEPGNPGSTQGGKAAGEHIHQLLSLAESLVRTAKTSGAADSSHAEPAIGEGQSSTNEATAGNGLLHTAMGLEPGRLSDDDAAAWAQTLEHLNRFLQGLMVHAAGDLSDRVAAGRYQETGSRKPVDYLSSSLKLSRAEANNRLRLAERFLPSVDPLTHVVTSPSQPVLGSTFFSGLVSAEQALVASGFVDQAARLEQSGTIAAEDVQSLETTLSAHAEVEPPYFLRHLGIYALALLDPDGQKPSEAQRLAKQGISFRRPYRGWVRIDGYMTISQYEQTMACIDWATNPKRANSNAQDAAQDESCDSPQGDEPTSGVPSGGVSPGTGSAQEGAQPEDTQLRPSPDHLARLLGNPESGLDMTPPPPPPAASPPPSPSRDSSSPETKAAPDSAPGHPRRGTCATGQGWRRPLASDEIPPRPPNAPPDAIPPAYEGESWFWFPDLSDRPNGWDAEPEGGVQGSPGPFLLAEPRSSAQKPHADGPSATQQAPESAWWSGPVPASEDGTGCEDPQESNQEPWPHLVNGVWVPAPGSEGNLPGLSPMDPNSTDPAVRDGRTRAQMLLDGMLHCLTLAAGTDKLPTNGGLKTQLYLSLTQEDLDRRFSGGTVDSPYSGQMPFALFAEQMCNADVTEMLVGSKGEILDVGRTQRLFTFAQRKVLVARDMGCAFPDCMAPAQWTEAHHIVPWQDGGATSVDNGVLCCSVHHHYLHDRGWSVRLVGTIAWFTPPYSEDITRRERRNTYHHDRIAQQR